MAIKRQKERSQRGPANGDMQTGAHTNHRTIIGLNPDGAIGEPHARLSICRETDRSNFALDFLDLILVATKNANAWKAQTKQRPIVSLDLSPISRDHVASLDRCSETRSRTVETGEAGVVVGDRATGEDIDDNLRLLRGRIFSRTRRGRRKSESGN